MYPHPPVAELSQGISNGRCLGRIWPSTYRLLERRSADALFLLALGRIVKHDPLIQDVDLTLGEDVPFWRESAMRPFERVRKEKAKYRPGENGESSHEDEEPEPPVVVESYV